MRWLCENILTLIGIVIGLAGIAITVVIGKNKLFYEEKKQYRSGAFLPLESTKLQQPASLQIETIASLSNRAKVTNIGKGVARNIRIESLDLSVYPTTDDNIPYKDLSENESFDIVFLQNYPHFKEAEVTIMWDDDVKLNNKIEATYLSQ